MIDTIIFLPGGGGSVLQFPDDPDENDAVWPPSALEFASHYGRLQQLLDPSLQATDIVDSIPLHQLLAYPVYRQILNDLYAIQSQTGADFIPFYYDFRKSVFDSADALIAKIQECYDNGSKSIALICHSTGNQIARAVLENVQYQGEDWFGSLSLYLGICGPHLGVPEVLEYGLGLSDWLSIQKGDIQTFSRDDRYPGMYQLFPFQGKDVLMDVNTGADDIYDSNVAQDFSLCQQNLDAAVALQAALNFVNKPPSVRYAMVAGCGQSTDETIQYNNQTFVRILPDDAGDGTVPLWSAAPGQFSPLITPGDHFSVLSCYTFRNYLWNLLAGMDAPSFFADVMGVTTSLNRSIYAPGEQMSVLLIPDQPTTEITGTLEIEQADPKAHAFLPFKTQPFAYRGFPIRSIRSEASAPMEPGLYRITLRGKTHSTAPETSGTFAVSADRRPP